MRGFESFSFRMKPTPPDGLGRAAFDRTAFNRPPVRTRSGANNRARTRVTPTSRGGMQRSNEAAAPSPIIKSRGQDIVKQAIDIHRQVDTITSLLHEWTSSGNDQHKETALAHMQDILDGKVFEFLFTTSKYPIELYRIEDTGAHETYRTSSSGTTLEITNIFREAPSQNDSGTPPRILLGTHEYAMYFEDFAHAQCYGAQLNIRPVSLK